MRATLPGAVTPLGRQMSKYPLEPCLSRMLIESTKLGCGEDVLTIAAMLSVENVYYKPPRLDTDETRGPRGVDAAALEAHIDLHHDGGDHIT